MLRIAALGLGVVYVGTAQQPFEKYKKIEGYEVRAGVLMMPRYAVDGSVCEIGLQKLYYSSGRVDLAPSLSREEIDQILNELVPAPARGRPSPKNLGTLIVQGGQTLTTTIDFENVAIQIFGATLPGTHKQESRVAELVAKVTWKRRTCQDH